MSNYVNPCKVITGPNTRWIYVNVWDPKSINGGTPKYSVSLIIPKTDAETIRKIREAIRVQHFVQLLHGFGAKLPEHLPDLLFLRRHLRPAGGIAGLAFLELGALFSPCSRLPVLCNRACFFPVIHLLISPFLR